MNKPAFSPREIEQLSAYLDGELPPAETRRLESRLKADPGLRAALDELRQTRALLRRAPRRRAPRNFTLTPRMAGLRAPQPRSVPILAWTSALATLLFIFSFSGTLLSRLTLGAAAPAVASAPQMEAYGSGLAETEQDTTEMAPMLAAPPEAEENARLLEATPTPPSEEATFDIQEQAAAPQAKQPGRTVWPFVWLALAILLGAAALLLRWIAQWRFRRKHPR